jgi:hypothetical protein
MDLKIDCKDVNYQTNPSCGGFTNPFVVIPQTTIYAREIVIGTSMSLTFVHFTLNLV